MGRASNIERLPEPIRERINELLKQKVTLDDILAKLAELGVSSVSRSGLGRYKQVVERNFSAMRQRLEVTNAMLDKWGDAPEGKQGRMLVEVVRSLIFDVLGAASEAADGGGALTLDPEAIARISRSLRDLAAAQKTDAELVMRLRKQLAAEAEEKLKKMEAEGGAPGAKGFDPDTLRRVREEIYGITGAQ